MKIVIDDGGREAAGFKGSAGDCVCRAIAIASGRPYKEVYDRLAEGVGTQRITKRQKRRHEHKGWAPPKKTRSAANGVSVMGAQFDLDVASPGTDIVPWIPATHCITKDSLTAPWSGFIWMNPPFGPRNGLTPWLKKFFEHSNGVALVPDRTSAPWWQRFVPSLAQLTR